MYVYVKSQPAGNDVMADLANQIHDGAMAFLRREYTVLAVFVTVVAVLLYLAIGPGRRRRTWRAQRAASWPASSA